MMVKVPVPDFPPTGFEAVKDPGVAPPATPRHWLSHAAKPHILFPALAVLVLAAIWGTALSLIAVERNAAERAAAASSRELAETYEAQVVRALREIDQTLKLVKYAYERKDRQAVLQELKSRSMLPPDLLFLVSIADSKGDVVASSRPSLVTAVADRDYFQSQREADIFAVGVPRQRPGSGEWRLIFSRRLNAVDGSFAGIVMVAVDAAYFVSGYDSSRLGEHGVLGLLGTDGIFRARRTGEAVYSGDKVDFAAVVPVADEDQGPFTLSISPWDGVERFATARQLYDFPLAVIVGVSADEQLAVMRRKLHVYLWVASAVSLLAILVFAVLGRMSRKLELNRQRKVAERIVHAARVQRLAYHDGLTALPNRTLFSKLLVQSIHQAHRYSRRLAVLYLDLDRFKQINDTLGHEAGDQLLQEVATRLRACLRDSDTIARLGGDEFVALLPELDEEKYAATVAGKILSAVARPFVLRGHEYRVTTSIGISIYPQDGLDEQTLKKNADIAMYRAKEEGKNNFKFYSKRMNAYTLERLALESDLRKVLERHELQLYYQARKDIRNDRITGTEALLRWQHPDLGTIAPMRFIPVAEDIGMIVPIGRWVLETACLQNVAWQNQGLPHLGIAVNLTARQFFDENLLADLKGILADTGMEAHLLELDISESLLMRDVDNALRILAAVKEMGIRFAIDDFGIGYASLAKLGPLPLDSIKIDRSFIRNVGSVAEDKDLTEAIIAMGRKLSLAVVAQGVETKEQADFLRGSACDEFQGFYFGKPEPAEQIADLLRAQSRTLGHQNIDRH